MRGLREVVIPILREMTANKRPVTVRAGAAAKARKLKRKRWV